MQYTARERERETDRKSGSIRYQKVFAWVWAAPVSESVSVFDMQPLILSYVLQCSVFGFGFSFRFVSVMVLGSLVDFGLHCWHLALAFFLFFFVFVPALLTWALALLGPAPAAALTPTCFQVLLALTCYCCLLLLFLLLSVRIPPTSCPLSICAPIS